LQRWFWAPITFFDLEYVVIAALVLLAWSEGISNGRDFQELAMQPDELSDPAPGYEEADWRAPLSYTTSRSQIQARFGRRWVWGALFLVLCAAVTQLEYRPGAGLQSIGIARAGLPPLMLAGLVLYFLVGLGLLSLGRLAALRARWMIDRIEGEESVTRRWPRVTLLLVLIVGGLTALLPLASTWRLGSWLRAAIGFLSRWALTIGRYIVYLIMALLGWLLAALGFDQTESVRPDPVRFEPPQLVEQPQGETIQLPAWLGNTLLWLLIGIVVVYALVTFLRARGWRVEWGRARLLWLRLRAWWYHRQRGLREAVAAMRETIVQRLARQGVEDRSGSLRWGLLNWRRLPPEAQIRLLYLFALRRARQQGVRRQPAETPHEHAAVLGASWPEVDKELGTLTQAFIEARYSARAFGAGEVRDTRQVWKRVRTALRRGASDRQAR
jgi:hypothetical protein